MRPSQHRFALRATVTAARAWGIALLRGVTLAIIAVAPGPTAIGAEGLRLESTVDRTPVPLRRIVSLDDTVLKVRPAPGEKGSDGERSIRREDLIALVFAPPSTGRPPRGTDLLSLTSGDRLRVVSAVSGEESLSASLAASSTTRLAIPLEQLRGLLRLARGTGAAEWSARLPLADGSSDVALLQNADRLRGEFLGLSEESLTFNTAAGETKIAREDVKGIAFSPELLSLRPIPARHAIVQFRDGSYLTVDTVRRGAGETDWQLALGDARLAIPEDALRRIAFYSESAASLLSQPLADRRTVPFLPEVTGAAEAEDSAAPAPSESASASAESDSFPPPPVLHGHPIPRGLEAAGRTEWTYDLDPMWTEFRAAANVPDAAGDRGSCVLRIEVDGKAVYESPLLRPASEDVPTPPVPLQSARTLKLVIDYGEFWDVRNRGIWIDPRLIRSAPDSREK